MAGKSSGDRRKPLRGAKGAKNAAPAKSIRVGVIDYKDVIDDSDANGLRGSGVLRAFGTAERLAAVAA